MKKRKNIIMLSSAALLLLPAAALFFGLQGCSPSSGETESEAIEILCNDTLVPEIAATAATAAPLAIDTAKMPRSAAPIPENAAPQSGNAPHLAKKNAGGKAKTAGKQQAAASAPQPAESDAAPMFASPTAVSASASSAVTSTSASDDSDSDDDGGDSDSNSGATAAGIVAALPDSVSVPAGSEQFAADSDTSGAANAAPPALAKPFRYEVGVYGTYGMAELSGKMAAGSMQPAAPAPGVGVDFSWCFAPRWGVAVGVEAAFPAVLLSSTGIEAAAAGAALSLRKRATRVDAVYLRVPLWLRFCTPAQRHRFYAALGASLDLTLSGRYRTEETTRTGSDIQTGVTSGSLPFGHGASLAAEAGWRWSLARRWGLYAGAYAAYGLSDIALYGHDTLQDVESISLLLVGVKVKIMINN